MDKETCNLEIQNYTSLKGAKLTHFSGGHSIRILQLFCRETKNNNYFISVLIRHILTGNEEETSIDFINTHYS